MVACDVVREREPYTPDPARRDALIQTAFKKGLLLLGCGEAAIRFCPPLCVTAAQVESALELLASAFAERPAETTAV
jgi:4-aminobutyrate aminotransferase